MNRLGCVCILAVALAAGCRMRTSEAELGTVERLNVQPGALGLHSFPYYVALQAGKNGGAVAIWRRPEGRFRPLVYRQAPDAKSPFGEERYLSPESVRDTISTIQEIARGAESGELYAMWQARRDATGDKFVLFRRSADAGATWDPEVRVNAQPTSFIPAIATDAGGGVYASWIDERRKGFRIFFNRSLDHGRTWLPSDVQVDASDERFRMAISVQIATDGAGRVVVIWEQRGGGGRRVYASASSDRGETWTPPVVVDDGTGPYSPIAPQVVFAGGRVVVVWSAGVTGMRVAGQVWADVSTDGGRTWGTDTLLYEVQGGPAAPIHLVADDGTPRLVFSTGPLRGSWQVYYTDLGADGSWRFVGDRLVQVGPPGRKLAHPRLAVGSAGTLYAVYEDDRTAVRLSRSRDGGATWTALEEPVSALAAEHGKATLRYPQATVAGDVVYVLWEAWTDPRATVKTLADADTKIPPADLYIRRVTFPH